MSGDDFAAIDIHDLLDAMDRLAKESGDPKQIQAARQARLIQNNIAALAREVGRLRRSEVEQRNAMDEIQKRINGVRKAERDRAEVAKRARDYFDSLDPLPTPPKRRQ